mgnify:FL=1
MHYLWRFHVEHFSNSALHNEEMRVVDIKLHWAEEILNSCIVSIAAVDQVLISASNHNLHKE